LKILLPKLFVDPAEFGAFPLYFLGGPIRGGGDWQSRMCGTIAHFGPRCFVACPNRWSPEHSFANRFMPGEEDRFERQTDWERCYLDVAGDPDKGERGCIIFWLEPQREDRPPTAGVYARDTLGEIGEWRGRMMSRTGLRVVIGADPEYDQRGVNIMQYNFEKALKRSFPIYRTMRATFRAAMSVAE